MSVKPVDCISVGKKVFPQTSPSKLSWLISKWNDFIFWKCVKMYFLELATVKEAKGLNFRLTRTEKPPNAQ